MKIFKGQKLKIVILLWITIFLFSCAVRAQTSPATYTDTQILWAIFYAEGGYKVKYLFGIRSVKYKDFEDAKRICLKTIQNNRKRYVDYGYKQYSDFLSFLASRYAPTKNCDNDPKGLNKFWLRNVQYYLMKVR